jgi:hypothetical protein
MSVPLYRTVPEVGFSSIMKTFDNVDFPQPDSPTMPSTSPSCKARLTSSTAWITPEEPNTLSFSGNA